MIIGKGPPWGGTDAAGYVPEAIRAPEPVKVEGRVPADAATRKNIQLATGLLDYFPDALMAVAELSRIGNEQHNPGQPLHWARAKSPDFPDTIMRHLIDRGTVDTDGVRHSTKTAWRALALLQTELEEANNLPISRGSK